MGIYTTNYIYRTGMWELNYLRTGGEEGESEEYREMGIYTTNYIYRTGMWELNYLRTGGGGGGGEEEGKRRRGGGGRGGRGRRIGRWVSTHQTISIEQEFRNLTI